VASGRLAQFDEDGVGEQAHRPVFRVVCQLPQAAAYQFADLP
jgi:hypothetical protein